MMYGNNEIGNRLPIAEVGAILKNHSAIFHTDAVQAYGSEVILPHELGIDLLSISAHKINGPKGVGFYLKAMQSITTSFTWWGTRRKTTCGHGKLSWNYWHGYCRFITNFCRKASKKNSLSKFSNDYFKALEEANIDFSINGEPTNRLAHVLNLHLKRNS